MLRRASAPPNPLFPFYGRQLQALNNVLPLIPNRAITLSVFKDIKNVLRHLPRRAGWLEGDAVKQPSKKHRRTQLFGCATSPDQENGEPGMRCTAALPRLRYNSRRRFQEVRAQKVTRKNVFARGRDHFCPEFRFSWFSARISVFKLFPSGFQFFMAFQLDFQGLLEHRPLDYCSREERGSLGFHRVWTLHT